MTQRISETFSMLDWSLATMKGDILPPRDHPDDEDEDEDEESDAEPEDEREPAVIREPDEDD
jgi:hypothetical protein